jgi:hypothetical protein
MSKTDSEGGQMPTESQVASFRKDAISSASKLIEFACPQLKSLVDKAEGVFRQCHEVSKNPKLDDFPSLALFRHIIEMGDGIEVLLCAGTAGPMIPIIRSMFEAYLSLGYITEKPEHYEQRSLAWMYWQLDHAIERKKTGLAENERGRQLKKVLEAQGGWPMEGFQDADSVATEIRDLENLLSKPVFEAIAKQRAKLKGTPRYWSRLCGGPNSVKDLADHLQWSTHYEWLYRRWSGVSHATDPSRHLVEQPDGAVEFGSLRGGDDLPRNLYYTFLFLWGATCLMLEKFFQRQDFAKSNEDMLYVYRRLDNFQRVTQPPTSS